jgi:hypothetical protein
VSARPIDAADNVSLRFDPPGEPDVSDGIVVPPYQQQACVPADGRTLMRSIRKATALVGALAILAALAACGGPDTTASASPLSLFAAAAPLRLTTPASQPTPMVGVEPESTTSSGEEDASYETCNLFRQMIQGIDYLSTDEQQQLIDQMADAAQNTGDPDLVQAVDDMSQGLLNSNPQQFASGMRAMSQICDVPYE